MFPVKAMSIVYRAKFLQALQQMIIKGEVTLPENTDSKQIFNLLYQKDWVVYLPVGRQVPKRLLAALMR